MHRLFSIALPFALCVGLAACKKDQPLPTDPPLFEKFYGGSGDDIARGVAHRGSDLIVAGYTNSGGSGANDFFLMRTDSAGEKKFLRYYGGSGDETCWGLAADETNDAYYMAGYTNSSGAGGYDVYVVRTNSAGEIVWTRTYGGAQDDYGYSVRYANNQIIVTGATYSYGNGSGDGWVLCLEPVSGDTLWTRTIGGSGDDGAMNSCAAQNSTATHAIVGYTNSSGSGSTDGFFTLLDANGTILQNQNFGTNGYDEPHAIVYGVNNYFATGHHGTVPATPTHNVFATGIRNDGSIEGFHEYGGAAHDGAEATAWSTYDHSLAIVARSESRSGYAEDVYLVHADASGNKISEQWIGTTSDDAGYGISIEKNAWVICGASRGGTNGGKDIYLTRVKVQ